MSSSEPSSSSRSLKVFFYASDLVGPQNACIGMGQALLKRGHDVYFLANEKFGNKFTKYGFKQLILRKPNESLIASKSVDGGFDVIQKTATDFVENLFMEDIDTKEQMRRMTIRSTITGDMYATCLAFEPQIRKLIDEEHPDVMIYESTIAPPSLFQSYKVPAIRMASSNPLCLFNSDSLPPFMSGLAIDSDPKLWQEFRQEIEQYYYFEVKKYQRLLLEQCHYPPVENLSFLTPSKYLNLYQFPEVLDYHDIIEIPSNMIRVEAFCREESEPYQLPAEFIAKRKPNGKLIYVSLGSMGSCYIDLMKKLVSILAKTPHQYIISRGLLHDRYELADNMIGDIFVPQTKVLPMVDLVIHHGGNNTLTESIYFGKPMIVIPMFYDQMDNAQRAHEKGIGIRLETHRFTEQQLIGAIDQLLSDDKLRVRMKQISERIKTNDSKVRACIEIEKMAANFHGYN